MPYLIPTSLQLLKPLQIHNISQQNCDANKINDCTN
jgi:hypothetical protein